MSARKVPGLPIRNSEKIRLLIPADEIEPEALKQLETAAGRDFVKMIAVMPDIHAGYDLPIGTVALTENVISPSFVGYDIGCGMCQVRLPDNASSILSDLRESVSVHDRIRQVIPLGFSSNRKPADYKKFESASGDKKLSQAVDKKLKEQLGTLGGGNHFIEIGRNESDRAFITIHSGSRNAGHQIAEYYMKLGHYLRYDSATGQAYSHDMAFMQEFALANRLAMVEKIALQVLGYSPEQWSGQILPTLINENHNHALPSPLGIIHRKGATPAEKNQPGVIPGNMRDGVYVTRGLGNGDYLSSASHGAGRAMSRTQARDKISLNDFTRDMEGIAADVGKKTIDEAPSAYKNLDLVMARQNHIVVEITDYVKPLVNVKG